jgi:hypothetical protein
MTPPNPHVILTTIKTGIAIPISQLRKPKFKEVLYLVNNTEVVSEATRPELSHLSNLYTMLLPICFITPGDVLFWPIDGHVSQYRYRYFHVLKFHLSFHLAFNFESTDDFGV